MAASASSSYQVGQVVTVCVERVLPVGMDVRLRDGTPAYVRWRDVTRGGHWDPDKIVAVGQEIEAVVVALATSERVMEVNFRR
jgi:ribosomal protein S1